MERFSFGMDSSTCKLLGWVVLLTSLMMVLAFNAVVNNTTRRQIENLEAQELEMHEANEAAFNLSLARTANALFQLKASKLIDAVQDDAEETRKAESLYVDAPTAMDQKTMRARASDYLDCAMRLNIAWKQALDANHRQFDKAFGGYLVDAAVLGIQIREYGGDEKAEIAQRSSLIKDLLTLWDAVKKSGSLAFITYTDTLRGSIKMEDREDRIDLVVESLETERKSATLTSHGEAGVARPN